jgi:DNA-directed RNA polymerase specialized sigma24 family protein
MSERIPPFSAELAWPVVETVAATMRWRFRNFPAWGYDDLVAEGLHQAWRKHAEFRASRAKYETWLSHIVRRRLLDVLRSAARDHVRAQRCARREVSVDLELLLAQHGIRKRPRQRRR